MVEVLVYVQSFTTSQFYYNVKSRNILLDIGMLAKLTSIGATRCKSMSDTMMGWRGQLPLLVSEVIEAQSVYGRLASHGPRYTASPSRAWRELAQVRGHRKPTDGDHRSAAIHVAFACSRCAAWRRHQWTVRQCVLLCLLLAELESISEVARRTWYSNIGVERVLGVALTIRLTECQADMA